MLTQNSINAAEPKYGTGGMIDRRGKFRTEKKDLRQNIAAACGITTEQLSRWCNYRQGDKERIDMRHLMAIAKILTCNVWELAADEDQYLFETEKQKVA